MRGWGEIPRIIPPCRCLLRNGKYEGKGEEEERFSTLCENLLPASIALHSRAVHRLHIVRLLLLLLLNHTLLAGGANLNVDQRAATSTSALVTSSSSVDKFICVVLVCTTHDCTTYVLYALILQIDRKYCLRRCTAKHTAPLFPSITHVIMQISQSMLWVRACVWIIYKWTEKCNTRRVLLSTYAVAYLLEHPSVKTSCTD